jgi:type VI secretion system secreted protein Hcp
MPFDAFLKIDGVPGESTDSKHKEWIEVLSYSHGLHQTGGGSNSSGGARSAGRTDHADFSIVKTLDKASPVLALTCSNGKHIPKVTMTLNRATGDKQEYMKYDMEDVLVTSVRPGGSSKGGDTLPLEEVSFNYGKITWEYTETDHKTGKAGGKITKWWSTVENKGG